MSDSIDSEYELDPVTVTLELTYTWTCPICDELNESEWDDVVMCGSCETRFKAAEE